MERSGRAPARPARMRASVERSTPHVQQIKRDRRHDGHRYGQEFGSTRWARSVRRPLQAGPRRARAVLAPIPRIRVMLCMAWPRSVTGRVAEGADDLTAKLATTEQKRAPPVPVTNDDDVQLRPRLTSQLLSSRPVRFGRQRCRSVLEVIRPGHPCLLFALFLGRSRR
jgi:hypothetical protein